MSAKPTPGPWELRKTKTTFGVDLTICTPAYPDKGSYIATVALGGQGGEREANAHLLKAAPDLLEALQGLLEYHRRDDYTGMAKRYQDAGDAAIAKATGEPVSS